MSNEEEDVKFTDLFNPKEKRVELGIMEKRLTVCKSCDHFKPRTQQCSKCGCFMSLKTTLRRAKCPMGYW